MSHTWKFYNQAFPALLPCYHHYIWSGKKADELIAKVILALFNVIELGNSHSKHQECNSVWFAKCNCSVVPGVLFLYIVQYLICLSVESYNFNFSWLDVLGNVGLSPEDTYYNISEIQTCSDEALVEFCVSKENCQRWMLLNHLGSSESLPPGTCCCCKNLLLHGNTILCRMFPYMPTVWSNNKTIQASQLIVLFHLW